MPQLMPLFWTMSIFVILFIIMVFSIFYNKKMLESDLIYNNQFDTVSEKLHVFMIFTW